MDAPTKDKVASTFVLTSLFALVLGLGLGYFADMLLK